MESACPNKDRCGSCGWSHIPYKKQLEQKLSDINGSFKLHGIDQKVIEIFPSPKTEHYRNRMDFVIDFKGQFGLREKGKWWRVIDGNKCFIADEQIGELFDNISKWIATSGLDFFDRKSHSGFLRYAVVRASLHGQTLINIVTSAPKDENLAYRAFAGLNSQAGPSTLIWTINNTVSDVSFGDEERVISGSGFIEEKISGFTYRISPQAFFQTNSHAAPFLLETVKQFTGNLSEKTLLDLYCGTGFFSVPLAKQAKKTYGLEMVETAIADAKINAGLNGSNAEYSVAKVEQMNLAEYSADVVIVDPPRSGMHDDALSELMRAMPETIIYVSCNYKSIARELGIFKKAYDIDSIRAIDMFPHTPHVELVVKLARK
ncbi:MAG: SAM-dependent methyltransferase [uncultured bacterium]|nr:MAG: SAM-dependent methyltransferase [uncultured bacterium]